MGSDSRKGEDFFYLCRRNVEALSFRYFIRLSFDGEPFHGWQHQHNAVTVQAILKESLAILLRHPVEITGAGRTDAGVHAREYFAHFDADREFTLPERDHLVFHLNGILPDAISVHEVFPVRYSAHARFSAQSRTYQYQVARIKDPFLHRFSYYYSGNLDLEIMNQGAALLKENIDFTSFAKLPAQTATNRCHISHAVWEEKEPLLLFTITADRFLRNMVRAIVGTLIDLGRGRTGLADLKRIILAKDRCEAGFSVPAKGLFLVSVKYPPEIFPD